MYYPSCSEVEQVFHSCDACGAVEKGRIRSIVLVDKSSAGATFIASAKAGTLNKTAWETAVDNGVITIIPDTSGSYDGGSAVTGDGYGDESERLISYTHTINVKDPSFKGNHAFWTAAEKVGHYLIFRTETLLHVVDSPVKIKASAPVEEGLDSDVTWQIAATWKSLDKPVAVDFSAVEDLFLNGCIARGTQPSSYSAD